MSPASADRLENVEGRRFIEGETGNPVRPLDGRVQRDTSAVGVPDEVHLAIGAIDDFDRYRSLVRKRESVRAVPRTHAFAAVVLGGDQVIARVQGNAELAPLRGAAARAMQRNDRLKVAPQSRGLLDVHGFLEFESSATADV